MRRIDNGSDKMDFCGVELKNNVFLAPMAGVTDLAFRLICKEMEVGLLYTEMVSTKALYYGDKKTDMIMEIREEEKPVALQIFGSDPRIMARVTDEKLNLNNDFSIIDINMGCPAPKIVKNGDGCSLMNNPSLVREIVREVVGASNKPVTVKIRKGWDGNRENAVQIAKIVESSGASAITVHGRTREEYYSGIADWDIIKSVKESVGIPVVGNGDIFEPEDALKMIEHTGCDAVMIGRGARGNPWIFKRTAHLLETGELLPAPTDVEKIEMSLRHLDLLFEVKPERMAIREMRKHIAWYIKGIRGSAEMRDMVNRIETRSELEQTLREYIEELKNQ